MRLAGLALAVSVAFAACSDRSPTAPDVASFSDAAGSAAATAFPEQNHGGRLFVVAMTGAEEAPGPGDPDGSGTARITLNAGQKEVCFALTVEDIAPATAAHIHEAPPGVPGPIVVGLQPPTSGSSMACVEASRDVIVEILKDPGQYYVNVHNAEFPAGAVRGQLSR